MGREQKIKSSTTNRTEEFKDKQERLVLKRRYIGTTAFSTYYVYNDLDLLCCVIPPKALADDGSISSTDLSQLCYQYKYDERSRLIEKRLPGTEWEYLIYDSRDRLVLSQDAGLRATNQYHYTLYDSFNRPAEQGISTDGTAYATLRNTVKNSSNYTPGTREAQIYTWYDYYDFRSGWGGTAVMDTFVLVYPAHSVTDKVKGLVTGSKTKVLESSPVKWIYTENYYDKYGRLLQCYRGNPEGGYNRETYAYDFEGQVTDKQTLHKKTASETAITIYETFTYDHMGRQLTSQFGYNTTTLTTLSTNAYDDLGRLSSKRQHNNQQYNDYTYNIRGWLTKINDPSIASTNTKLFAMQLYYDADMTTSLSGGAQFNGNINGIKWRQYNGGSNLYKGYNFTYDGLNRLTNGDYGTLSGSTWSNPAAYDLNSVSYDANGNITALNRKNNGGTDKDNFSFTLTGNHLSAITGTLNGSYSYDGNGSLTSDGPRSLTISYYKELDLPKQYYKDASNKEVCQYDATGIKWSKAATINGNASTALYYGPFIYESGSLSKILTSEGYYEPITGRYHYYLKDHLGNTRITYYYSGTTPVIDQEVEYYPFGLLFAANNLDKNRYLYNGKELNNEFFENYDYGARFYDPQLGRFHTVDRYAADFSSWSPYHYASNNPISYIDVNGDSTYTYNIATNTMKMISDVGGNEQQIVNFVNEDGSALMLNDKAVTATIDGEQVYVTPTSQGTLISSYDPVSNLPDNYNSESGYEYTAADLRARHNIEGTSFEYIVAAKEASGNAAPIASKTAYQEYVKKWGTDKAFWYGIEGGYFSNTLPGIPDILSGGQKALSSGSRNIRTFSPNFSNVKSPITNSWNRYLHANKGSGKSIQQLAKEYNRLMKGK